MSLQFESNDFIEDWIYMLHILIESGHFVAEREKVEQLKSPIISSAVSMVESAYWLIAGDRFTQALVTFDGAIELLLKGELERIHPILIAQYKSLEKYEVLQSFVKDSFHRHPVANQLKIPDIDFERTIYFKEAFDRITAIYPILKQWQNLLVEHKNSLHNLRNEIVHHGGTTIAQGQYVSAVIEVALPFIEQFLTLVTQHHPEPVRLSHLLFEWVYREVDVAQKVLSDLRTNNLPPAAYAIAPLAHHILWTNTQWPKPTDDQTTIVSHGFSPWFEYAHRYENPNGWDNVVEVQCPICGSDTREGDYIPARVLLEDEPLERKQLVPEGFICLVCGFEIRPAQKYLARHFIPTIPRETADAFLKDIGIE